MFQGDAANAGAINVLYGSAAGLVEGSGSFWHQNSNIRSTAVGDTVEAGDGFGASPTTGDFNGDAYEDLAVGAPGESAGATANAGAVNILYGMRAACSVDSFAPLISQFGTRTALASQGSPKIATLLDTHWPPRILAKTLSDDLAIGVQGESLGAKIGAGAVQGLYGCAEWNRRRWKPDMASGQPRHRGCRGTLRWFRKITYRGGPSGKAPGQYSDWHLVSKTSVP